MDTLDRLKVGTSTYEIKDSVARASIPTNYAGSATTGGVAYKTAGIPIGTLDSTSTATVMTAQINGITELADGVCMLLTNGVVTSATNCTLNINGLGAKPIYHTMGATSRVTNTFNVNYTMFFVYNSSRVSGGCWDMYYGYYADTNTNTIGYYIRYSQAIAEVHSSLTRYKLLFQTADSDFEPTTAVSNSTATTKAITQVPINPFAPIIYYSGTATVNAGALIPVGNAWTQYQIDLRYAFNAGSTLVAGKEVFVRCNPQADGTVVFDGNACVTQTLPTAEDGKVYISLGYAYNTTNIILTNNHPVYCYKNGIRPWTVSSSAVYSNTVSGWASDPTLISEKDAIYVYTDYEQDENGNNVPGIKIGDGLAYLIDMPFVDAVMQEHIADTVIHVTQADKDNWNNKCSVQYVGNETLQFDV